MTEELRTDQAVRRTGATLWRAGNRILALLVKTRAHLLVPMLAILLFEGWHVAPYGNFNVTYYDEQADALLAGQLSLLRAPPPGLLALPDPWDPVDNLAFSAAPYVPGERYQGVLDLALRDGKFYLQWGLAPAVILIPLRWVVGHDLPMGYVALVLETLAALASAAATLILARLAGLPASRLMPAVIVTGFLVCPVWAAVLHRVAIYEAAIFFAQFFTALALLSVAAAFDRRLQHRGGGIWLLGLAGTCLGLVVNCRQDLVPLGLTVPPILWAWWRTGAAGQTWRRMIGPALALGAPAALLLGVMLLLNQLRFGNALESGQALQLLGAEDIRRSHFVFLQPARLLPNIYYYFLIPVVFNARYPLLLGSPLLIPASWLSPSLAAAYDVLYLHRTSGLFGIAPVTLFALAWPMLWRNRRNGAPDRLRPVLSLLLLAGLASSLLILAPAVMRYGAEWCMWWLVAGALMSWRMRVAVRARYGPNWQRLFDTGLVVSTAWSAWVGAALLITG